MLGHRGGCGQKKPVIDIDHVTLNCTQDPGVAYTGQPVVTDNCSSVIDLSCQDSLIGFGYTGFEAYYDPANRDLCLINMAMVG